MAAIGSDIDVALEELEARLERLRALYEQYFIGIEKLEPSVPRQDVDRRIHALRKVQIRNTAKRFRLQHLIQRYNTFQQYWLRTCREIESGTYHRHVARAQSRFGEVPLTAAARRRARLQQPSEEREPAAEDKARATRSAEDDLAALLQEEPEAALAQALAAAEGVVVRAAPSAVQPSASAPAPEAFSVGGPPGAPVIDSAAPGEPTGRGRAAPPPRPGRSRRGPEPTSVPPAPEGASTPAQPPRPGAPPPRRHRAEAAGDAAGATAPRPEADVAPRARVPLPDGVTRLEGGLPAGEPSPGRASVQPPPRRRASAAPAAGSAPRAGRPSARPERPAAAAAASRPAAPGAEPPRRAEKRKDSWAALRAPEPSFARPEPRGVAAGSASPPSYAPATLASGAASAGTASVAPPVRSGAGSAVESRLPDEGPTLTVPLAPAPAPRSARRAPPAAASRPRPAGPAQAAPGAEAGSRLDPQRLSQLHGALVAERRRLNQPAHISIEALGQTLRDTETKLQKQYSGKAIDFRVVVKDGKAVVKPVIG